MSKSVPELERELQVSKKAQNKLWESMVQVLSRNTVLQQDNNRHKRNLIMMSRLIPLFQTLPSVSLWITAVQSVREITQEERESLLALIGRVRDSILQYSIPEGLEEFFGLDKLLSTCCQLINILEKGERIQEEVCTKIGLPELNLVLAPIQEESLEPAPNNQVISLDSDSEEMTIDDSDTETD